MTEPTPVEQIEPPKKPLDSSDDDNGRWQDAFLMACILIAPVILVALASLLFRNASPIVLLPGGYFLIATWAAALNSASLIESDVVRLFVSMLIGAVVTVMAFFAWGMVTFWGYDLFGISFKDPPLLQSILVSLASYLIVGGLIILVMQIIPRGFEDDDDSETEKTNKTD